MRPLYCLIGKSGSGKDTLADELSRIFGFKKVLSYTTREPRSNRDRLNHYFSDINIYRNQRDAGEIITDTLFDGNYYWTTQQQLDNADIYVVDPEGYCKLLENYKRTLIPIYIHTDNKIRYERMQKRGDSEASIVNRLNNEFDKFQRLDYIKFAICVFNNEKPIRNIIHRLKDEIIRIGEQMPDETIVIQ